MCACVCVCVCVTHTTFCLSINGHVGCFYFLVMVNNAAINMGVQLFLGDPAFTFGTAGAYGNFNFLRNCHVIFHSGCTILLHSYQECTRVLFFFHIPVNTYFLPLFDSSHPNGCGVVAHCGSAYICESKEWLLHF